MTVLISGVIVRDQVIAAIGKVQRVGKIPAADVIDKSILIIVDIVEISRINFAILV